ncbi:MAG TPA: hypothetical protein VMU90_13580 [Solirubrobacteraceae bacterium]|nr:hypothetical protein [Solirubrobacteraceae bacterium]
MLALLASGCGGGGGPSPAATVLARPSPAQAPTAPSTPAPPPKPKPPPPPQYPLLVPGALGSAKSQLVPVVLWQGQPAAKVARPDPSVTLLSFDQQRVRLRLHAGTVDPGTSGWQFGPAIAGTEAKLAVAAINGGFRLNVGAGGFEASGRVAVPLQDGLGSIVTYSDGHTDIGSWHHGVPAPGQQVESVRQNLQLLVDHGQPASNADCQSCWGATLGGVDDPARAALGITSDGSLVWAAGEHLTVSHLAQALVSAHVQRAVELDINPEWVAGYVFAHNQHDGAPHAVPALPDQQGIPGQFLTPWVRDFFAFEARSS